MATGAFATGIPRIHTTRENTRVICFVLGIGEDTSLHPIGPFVVSPFAVFPLGRFEVSKVLKHQDCRLMLLGKLDNTSTHEMCYLFINVAYCVPEVCIVLLTFCDDASLASIA